MEFLSDVKSHWKTGFESNPNYAKARDFNEERVQSFKNVQKDASQNRIAQNGKDEDLVH